MKLDPKTFLALDGTASAIMHAVWEPIAEAAIAEIAPMLDAGRFASAHDAIDRLVDMDGVVSPQRKRLEELAVSALIFGAHHVSGDISKTAFTNGVALPKEIAFALDQLDHAITADGTTILRTMLHKLVASLSVGDTSRVSLMKCTDDSFPECACGGVHLSSFDPHLGQQSRLEAVLERSDPFYRSQRPTSMGCAPDEPVYDTPRFMLQTHGGSSNLGAKALESALTHNGRRKLLDAPKDVGLVALRERSGLYGETAAWRSPMQDAAWSKVRGYDALYPDAEPVAYDRLGFYNPPRTMWFENTYGDAPPIGNWRFMKDDAAGYAEKLYDATMNGGKGLIDIAATLTTSRIISLGFLTQASRNGVDTYRINEVLDDKTCPVCRYMNGKKFRVANELGRTLQALSASDPQDLRTIAPWPSQSKAGLQSLYAMSPEDLQASGYGSPPFHPNCRGMLSLVEEDQAQVDANNEAEPEVTRGGADQPSEQEQQDDQDNAVNLFTEGLDAATDILAGGVTEDAALAAPPIPEFAVTETTAVITDPELRRQLNDLRDLSLQEEIIAAYGKGDIPLLKSLLDQAGIAYTEDQLYQD